MNTLYKHIIIMVAAMLPFLSCKNMDEDIIQQDEKDVYVSFQTNFVGKESPTRAQGAEPSINTDTPDEEDFVKKLAVLIFDSGTGTAKIAEEYTSSSFFILKMKPGNYDFYFIANYTATDVALKAMTKTEVNNYLQTDVEFVSYSGAKASGVPFAMARVYRNQQVSDQGGTFANPSPFKPNLENYTNQLEPVSSFGHDWQGATTQQTVNLIRACAKISLAVSGTGKADISKIEYVNAAKNYTFAQLPDTQLPSQENVASNLNFTFTAPSGTENITSRLYVPERLFASSESKGWNRDKTTGEDEPIGKVNYIQITMKSGKMYKIPVISSILPAGTAYLDFARDNTKADYNIIRNNHYQYNINIPLDGKEIEIVATVLPWTLVQSEMSYGAPKYTGSVSFPNAGGEVMDDKQTVWLHQQNIAKVSFKLMAPKGAIWRASLTNGLDFSLYADPAPNAGETGAVTGIADPDVFYTMYIKPSKPWQGTPRFTEFYITVNGQEMQIVPALYASGTPSGPGKRSVFQQVE